MNYNKENLAGYKNPMFGKKHNNETKEKIRQKALGRPGNRLEKTFSSFKFYLNEVFIYEAKGQTEASKFCKEKNISFQTLCKKSNTWKNWYCERKIKKTMNKLDLDYQELLSDILKNGTRKEDRTGTGTISVFGRTIRHDMKSGFPLLTTKRIKFDLVVTELLWFLRGDTNIKYLVDNGCHIWDGDVYKNYDKFCIDVKWMEPVEKELNGEVYNMGRKYTKEAFINKIKTDDEFAKKWGELGPIYGKQWRSWSIPKIDSISLETVIDTLIEVGNGITDEYLHEEASRLIKERDKNQPIDQIANLINDLKTNPDSRRLLVSAWAVHDLPNMVLPPCHYGFQVYTRELSWQERFDIHKKYLTEDKLDLLFEFATNENLDSLGVPKRAISLMFNMRSSDVPLGLPFNIASYGLLLEIIAKMVNMVPDELIANLGDAHIYKNQIDGVKEQLTRTPMKLPTLTISDDVNFNNTIDGFLESCNKDSFKLYGYESHPSIKMPLSN